MPELFAGIELNEGVRLAWLARTPASYQLARTASLSLPGEKDPAGLARAACELIAQNDLRADRYALALPSSLAVLRNLEFPFSSARKISQVFRLELESRCLAHPEDVVSDYILGPRNTSGLQRVIAASLGKEPLARCLEVFREAGLYVRAADLDLGAVNALIPHALGERGGRLLFVHAEEHWTGLVLRDQGRPVLLRALPLGAARLREDPDGENRRLFKREILTSLFSLDGGEACAGIPVAVWGPRAREDAFRDALMRALGLTTPPISPMRDFLPSQADADADPSGCAVALGAAFRAVDPGEGMNFLQNEFAQKSPASPGAGRAVLIGLAAFTLAAWLFSVIFDIALQRSRLAELDAQEQRIVTKAVGEVKGGLTGEQYLSILKNRLREAENSTQKTNAGAGLVEALRQITLAVDPGLGAVIEYFGATEDGIRIRAQADAYEAVERIRNGLMRSGAFESVTIKEAKAEEKGKGVSFELDIVRKK